MRKARVKNGRGRHAWGTCEAWSLGYATGTAVRAPRNNAWLTIDANGKGILTVPFAWEQLLLLLETNTEKGRSNGQSFATLVRNTRRGGGFRSFGISHFLFKLDQSFQLCTRLKVIYIVKLIWNLIVNKFKKETYVKYKLFINVNSKLNNFSFLPRMIFNIRHARSIGKSDIGNRSVCTCIEQRDRETCSPRAL